MSILEKLTTRNFLACATGTTFLGLVTHLILNGTALLENPVVTGLLGIFGTLTALVFQFYFRTAGSPNGT